jgi:hypothetical protein
MPFITQTFIGVIPSTDSQPIVLGMPNRPLDQNRLAGLERQLREAATDIDADRNNNLQVFSGEDQNFL